MKLPVRSMTAVSLCAAALAVSAWLCVPAAVPFTLQSLAVSLAACLLGGRRAGAAVGVYLAVGAAGVPVFAGFRGGLSVLAGPTGGFLWGLLAMAVLAGWLVSRKCPVPLALAVGHLACYLCGGVWFAVTGGALPAVLTAVAACVFPDALKAAVAVFVARRVGREVRAWL